jgi:hypothetical protein
MNKIQSIIGLLIFIIIVFSMNMIFGKQMSFSNEYFTNNKVSTGIIGYELEYKPVNNIPNGDFSGNMRYPGKAYLGISNGNTDFMYNNRSDDSPLHFGFPL